MFPIDLQAANETSLLTWLVLSPLFGACLLALPVFKGEKLAQALALLTTVITAFLSFEVLGRFKDSADFQLLHSVPWLPKFGISYILGVDGISICLIVLTTLLSILVVASAGSVKEHRRAYLLNLLLLETGMLGVFLALDAITFYVFWELMLVPMYFLIGRWGGARRVYAALKFVLYTAFGSLLMLVAIVYCAFLYYQQFGDYSFAISDWTLLSLSYQQEVWLFAAFALAFSIKVPVFPFHTWLPDAHVQAPTGGSVILAGVLLKMGLYGLIRIGIPVFPVALDLFAPVFIVLGLVGIVYGALVAWAQTDIKKLVAYSSISHLGFCVLGFAVMNFEGLQGCILQMVNHGISTGALFLLVGALYDRTHNREISHYGGIANKVPVFATVFLVFTLSSIGLPLTNGFVGEFLLIFAGFKYSMLVGLIAVSGVILGAIYMLSLYRRVVFGPEESPALEELSDLNFREKIVLAPLVLAVFVFGLFPGLILERSAASSRWYVELANSSNAKSIESPVEPQGALGRKSATGVR